MVVNKSTLHMCIFLAIKVSLINVQRHNEMRLFSKENSLETLPSVYEVWRFKSEDLDGSYEEFN